MLTPLAKIRVVQGFSQAELGKAIGRSRALISLFERGIALPTRDLKEKISQVLGQDSDFLFPPEDR